MNPSDKRLAILVEDHPLEYGSFEGVIPEGMYGAGQVLIWDKGYYEPIDDIEVGFKKGSFSFRLFGEKLKGEFVLFRLKKSSTGKDWLIVKKKEL